MSPAPPVTASTLVTRARDGEVDAREELARQTVAAQLEGKQLVKTVVVPDRLVNFVVR